MSERVRTNILILNIKIIITTHIEAKVRTDIESIHHRFSSPSLLGIMRNRKLTQGNLGNNTRRNNIEMMMSYTSLYPSHPPLKPRGADPLPTNRGKMQRKRKKSKVPANYYVWSIERLIWELINNFSFPKSHFSSAELHHKQCHIVTVHGAPLTCCNFL